jgi:hypothetical protein
MVLLVFATADLGLGAGLVVPVGYKARTTYPLDFQNFPTVAMSVVLPSETLGLTLVYLSLRGLASASLVSRAWQTAAFPLLYHTLYLTGPSHLKQIASRVASDNGAALSLRTHVRGLVLDEKGELFDGDERYIGKDDLAKVDTILAGFSRLEHFSWELSFFPLQPKFIEILQTKCPNLNSVHFTIEKDLGSTKAFLKGRSIVTLPMI